MGQDARDEITVEEVVAMADESPESPQRWTAKRRALVVSILKGDTTAQAATRNMG